MWYEDKNKWEVLYVKLLVWEKGESLKVKAESFFRNLDTSCTQSSIIAESVHVHGMNTYEYS